MIVLHHSGKILDYLLLFLLVIASGGIYHQLWGHILSPFFLIVLIIAFYVNQPTIKKNFLSKTYGALLLLVFIVIVNYVLAPYENSLWFYVKFLLRITSISIFILYYFCNNQSLKNDIERCLYFFAIHAFISFLIYPFISSFLSPVVSEKISGLTFLNVFYYASCREILGEVIYRNQGLFWEPGILQIYMNLLVYYSLFERKSLKKSLFPAFLVLTTQSTTGLAVLIILYLVYYINSITFSCKQILFSSVFVLLLGIPLFYFFLMNLEEKVGSMSYRLRMYDMVNAFELIRAHPICGIGFDMDTYMLLQTRTDLSKYADLNIYEGDLLYERGNTNSFIMLIIQIGIPLFLAYTYILYCQKIFKAKGVFLFIISVSLMTEPLLLSNFFLMIFILSFINCITKMELK